MAAGGFPRKELSPTYRPRISVPFNRRLQLAESFHSQLNACAIQSTVTGNELMMRRVGSHFQMPGAQKAAEPVAATIRFRHTEGD